MASASVVRFRRSALLFVTAAALVFVCGVPAWSGAARATGDGLRPFRLSGTGTFWSAINDSNEVAGFEYAGSTPVPVRWQDGVTTRLTTGGSGNAGGAFAIDGAGALFGGIATRPANEGTPAVWSASGELKTLSAVSGLEDSLNVTLRSASGNGNAIGLSNLKTDRPPGFFYALAPGYAPVQLGLTTAGASSVAINDAGHIAVGSSTAPYLLVNGAHRPLRVVIGSWFDLNDNDDVAGMVAPVKPGGGEAAIELANGTLEVLPPLHAGDAVRVNALNDHDEAVGTSGDSAVAWIDGKVIPVSELVAGGFSAKLENAVDVNNNGSILAEATAGSNPAYYLLAAKPGQSFGVAVSLASDKADVGSEVVVNVTVSAGSVKLTNVDLGKGLESSEAATVSETPSGLNGFDLDARASRTFMFKAKGVKVGIATLSVSATAMTASGSAQGSGQATVKVVGTTIEGRVTYDDGSDRAPTLRGVPGAMVDIRGPQSATAVTDAQGFYSATVKAGTYRVAPTIPPAWVASYGDEPKPSSSTVTVASGDTVDSDFSIVDPLKITLKPDKTSVAADGFETVTVKVSAERGGKPVPDELVSVRPFPEITNVNAIPVPGWVCTDEARIWPGGVWGSSSESLGSTDVKLSADGTTTLTVAIGTVPGQFKLVVWAETSPNTPELKGDIRNVAPELSLEAASAGNGGGSPGLTLAQRIGLAAKLDKGAVYHPDPLLLASELGHLAVNAPDIRGLAFAPIATTAYNGLLIYPSNDYPLVRSANNRLTVDPGSGASVLPNSYSGPANLLITGSGGFSNALIGGLIPEPLTFAQWTAGAASASFVLAHQAGPTMPRLNKWEYFGFPYPSASTTCNG